MTDDPRTVHYLAVLSAIEAVGEVMNRLETARILADGNVGIIAAAVGDDPPDGTLNRDAHLGAAMMRRHVQQAMSDGRMITAALEDIKDRI